MTKIRKFVIDFIGRFGKTQPLFDSETGEEIGRFYLTKYK
jgi:hypothetical protein